MDKKEGQNLALTLFRKDLDKNDVVTTSFLSKSLRKRVKAKF